MPMRRRLFYVIENNLSFCDANIYVWPGNDVCEHIDPV